LSHLIEEEMQKCKEDPVYFYENYFLIDGEKPPKLHKSQKNNLRVMASGVGVIMMNGRQGYKTLFRKVLTSHLPDFIKDQKQITHDSTIQKRK